MFIDGRDTQISLSPSGATGGGVKREKNLPQRHGERREAENEKTKKRENEKTRRWEVHYSLPSLAGGHRGVKTLHHCVILSRVYNSLLLQRFDFLCERFNLPFE